MARHSQNQMSLNIHSPKENSAESDILNNIDPAAFQNTINLLQKKGEPLFTINDLRTTQHTLAQILRLVCIINHISKESLRESHRRTALKMYMPTNKITEDFNNLHRAIMYPRVTWDFIEKLFSNLELDITDVTIQLTHRETGEVFTVSKSDAVNMVKDNPVMEYTLPPFPQIHRESHLRPTDDKDK